MAIDLQIPADAELEVSLFGPGTGECIVAHLGGGEWMIVDSCISKSTGQPVALDYLESLGVSPSRVVLIVISHFHDDHIKGINLVIKTCLNARVCISDALTRQEAFAFFKAHSLSDVLVDKGKPSTHEISAIVDLLNENNRSFTWASEATRLYLNGRVEVFALSPSNQAISQSRLDFSAGFNESCSSFRKLANKLTSNLCAVALHITDGQNSVLLGSDLETSGCAAIGWDAVIASQARPLSTASVFKVPHHGSSTGHCDAVVQQLLTQLPISILTTMNSSHLPLERDLERIKAYSGKVYLTTEPIKKPPKRDRAVDEMLESVAKSRRVIVNVMGHIQLRMSGQGVRVCLNDHAKSAA